MVLKKIVLDESSLSRISCSIKEGRIGMLLTFAVSRWFWESLFAGFCLQNTIYRWSQWSAKSALSVCGGELLPLILFLTSDITEFIIIICTDKHMSCFICLATWASNTSFICVPFISEKTCVHSQTDRIHHFRAWLLHLNTLKTWLLFQICTSNRAVSNAWSELKNADCV